MHHVQGTSSTLTHTTLVIIVIIELFFAFGVAVVCVLFSWNLMRSIRSANTHDASFHSMPQGDFPRVFSNSSFGDGDRGGRLSASVLSEPLTGTYNTFYRGRGRPSNPDLSGVNEGERKAGPEWDLFSEEEGQDMEGHTHAGAPAPASSLFQSFFSYVRIM